MKHLVYIFFLLTINCYSQEPIKFEHWEDKYNKEDSIEIKKSQEFLISNNIRLLEIYNSHNGKQKKFNDSLPYTFTLNADTIVYLIPGGLFPTTRNDFKNIFLTDKKRGPYYIENVRKDGRLGVIVLREYRFLKKDNKLYFVFLASKLDKKDEIKLYDKLYKLDSEIEKVKIKKEIEQNSYYKSELIFDFGKQLKDGDKIFPEQNRYSELLMTFNKENTKYYKFKTNISAYNDGLIESEFIIDKDYNFFLIENHEIDK